MKKLLFLGIFVTMYIYCSNWDNLLKDYREVMGDDTYQFINKQYQEYILGNAPAIVDSRVKQIEIIDCGEPMVDIKSVNNTRIGVMEGDLLLKAHSRPEDIDPRAENYSYVRLGVYDALCRMTKELDLLAPHFSYEVGDLEIKLFEGLSDLETQKILFDSSVARILKNNPNMTEQEAYDETCKWVSPYINNVPVHSTGAAVDIALYSKKADKFCDMGKFNSGGIAAPIFSEEISLDQQKNRLLFLIAATRAGFTNYLNEFWHFSYGDRYASYWRESNPQNRVANYGSVK